MYTKIPMDEMIQFLKGGKWMGYGWDRIGHGLKTVEAEWWHGEFIIFYHLFWGVLKSPHDKKIFLIICKRKQ